MEGFSLNFLLLNTFGYICYLIFTSAGFLFHEVDYTGTVDLADFLFASHAMLIIIIEWI